MIAPALREKILLILGETKSVLATKNVTDRGVYRFIDDIEVALKSEPPVLTIIYYGLYEIENYFHIHHLDEAVNVKLEEILTELE